MLIDDIREDRMAAMKAKDAVLRGLLDVLIGDCCKAVKQPSDEDVVKMVKKFINNCELTIAKAKEFPNENTPAIIEAAEVEIKLLEVYLPSQMAEADIVAAIEKAKEAGLSDMGKIMLYFKTHHIGTYDGKLVSELVKHDLARR